MTLEELSALPLHTLEHIDDWLTVRRVPGGWIYTVWGVSDTDEDEHEILTLSTTFVPNPFPVTGLDTVAGAHR